MIRVCPLERRVKARSPSIQVFGKYNNMHTWGMPQSILSRNWPVISTTKVILKRGRGYQLLVRSEADWKGGSLCAAFRSLAGDNHPAHHNSILSPGQHISELTWSMSEISLWQWEDCARQCLCFVSLQPGALSGRPVGLHFPTCSSLSEPVGKNKGPLHHLHKHLCKPAEDGILERFICNGN